MDPTQPRYDTPAAVLDILPDVAPAAAPVALMTPQPPAKRDTLPAERLAIDAAHNRLVDQPARYQVTLDAERSVICAPHSDTAGHGMMQAAAFGTTSHAFAWNGINDLVSVLRGQREKATEQELNAALALVGGGEPQNEVEATLLIQMAATHAAAMQCLLTATGDLKLATDGGVGNLSVKLLRQFTAQVEALTKLRRGGEQVVRHIHVDNRGGQAMIADTITTGGAV